MVVAAESGQQPVEVVAGECPVEGLGGPVVAVLKGQKSFGYVVEIEEVARYFRGIFGRSASYVPKAPMPWCPAAGTARSETSAA